MTTTWRGPTRWTAVGVLSWVMINDSGFKDLYNNIGDTTTNPKQHKPTTVTHEQYDLTIGEKIYLKDNQNPTKTGPIQTIFLIEHGIVYPLKILRCKNNF